MKSDKKKAAEPQMAPVNKPVISDQQLQEMLSASPAPRITDDYIATRIARHDFTPVNDNGIVCVITLDNGFSVSGFSAAVNRENFKAEIAEKLAYERAFEQLYSYLGFLLAEVNYAATKDGASDQAETAKPTEPKHGQQVKMPALDFGKIVHGAVERVHKDSGISSDVTNACRSAVEEELTLALNEAAKQAA